MGLSCQLGLNHDTRPAWPLQNCSFLPLCLQGFFLPCLLDFEVLPESPMCHAREEHGKMQRNFIEHKKGKSFITVECSFVSV